MNGYIRVPISMSFMDFYGKEMFPTTAYDIVDPKKMKWVKTLCLWALRKVGAIHQHFDERMLLKEVALSKQDVISLLVREASVQIEQLGRRPEMIYMGRPQLSSLMSEPLSYRHPFTFELTASWSEPGKNKLYGIPVTIIPWMDGVLVI